MTRYDNLVSFFVEGNFVSVYECSGREGRKSFFRMDGKEIYVYPKEYISSGDCVSEIEEDLSFIFNEMFDSEDHMASYLGS